MEEWQKYWSGSGQYPGYNPGAPYSSGYSPAQNQFSGMNPPMSQSKASILGSLITGGANLIGGIGGTVVQGLINNWSYNKQKKDALAMWKMQNDYNHPAAVMARLKEAGLNPNLIYGGSGAQTPASPIKAPDHQAPQIQGNLVGDAISSVQSYQAHSSNLEKLAALNMNILERTESAFLNNEAKALLMPYLRDNMHLQNGMLKDQARLLNNRVLVMEMDNAMRQYEFEILKLKKEGIEFDIAQKELETTLLTDYGLTLDDPFIARQVALGIRGVGAALYGDYSRLTGIAPGLVSIIIDAFFKTRGAKRRKVDVYSGDRRRVNINSRDISPVDIKTGEIFDIWND